MQRMKSIRSFLQLSSCSERDSFFFYLSFFLFLLSFNQEFTIVKFTQQQRQSHAKNEINQEFSIVKFTQWQRQSHAKNEINQEFPIVKFMQWQRFFFTFILSFFFLLSFSFHLSIRSFQQSSSHSGRDSVMQTLKTNRNIRKSFLMVKKGVLMVKNKHSSALKA